MEWFLVLMQGNEEVDPGRRNRLLLVNAWCLISEQISAQISFWPFSITWQMSTGRFITDERVRDQISKKMLANSYSRHELRSVWRPDGKDTDCRGSRECCPFLMEGLSTEECNESDVFGYVFFCATGTLWIGHAFHFSQWLSGRSRSKDLAIEKLSWSRIDFIHFLPKISQIIERTTWPL